MASQKRKATTGLESCSSKKAKVDLLQLPVEIIEQVAWHACQNSIHDLTALLCSCVLLSSIGRHNHTTYVSFYLKQVKRVFCKPFFTGSQDRFTLGELRFLFVTPQSLSKWPQHKTLAVHPTGKLAEKSYSTFCARKLQEKVSLSVAEELHWKASCRKPVSGVHYAVLSTHEKLHKPGPDTQYVVYLHDNEIAGWNRNSTYEDFGFADLEGDEVAWVGGPQVFNVQHLPLPDSLKYKWIVSVFRCLQSERKKKAPLLVMLPDGRFSCSSPSMCMLRCTSYGEMKQLCRADASSDDELWKKLFHQRLDEKLNQLYERFQAIPVSKRVTAEAEMAKLAAFSDNLLKHVPK